MASNQAKTILQNVFGYNEFRPLQEKIIDNVLRKNDTLAIMPTGGGKSLCYQIPAMIFPGLTIVVSPLISLMKDQVEQLTVSGVAAVFLNSSLPPIEYRRNVEQIKQNKIKIVYLAPETLLKQKILAMLSSVKVECIAIDEAHCISAWGHDFRPEYRQLVEVRSHFPDAVCIALTATATPTVREDIKNTLHFDASGEFIASFNRENLFIQIVPKSNPLDQTIKFIKKFPDQSGIIYCFTRKQVDDLSSILKQNGFSVKPYHAGLSEEDRKENQELFIRDDVQIIVATIAFGMGINKPNIRFVVHFDLPKNIESYYQEIGRAGRDGLKSDCLLLFSYADIQKIKYFINQKNDHEKRVANIHLNALLRFLETDICRRIPLLTYFGEAYSAKTCNMCDNCLAGKKELVDLTMCAQKFLSCVKRTGEVFGAVHIIDVLRGSKAQKVINSGHQYLSTYGIGINYSKKQWLQISRQLLHKGLMVQDMEFGGLKLTKKAWAVLHGKATFSGRLEEESADDISSRASMKETMPEHDRGLFDILRKKRKEVADAANVPPYVIFSDKTLIEMAAFFPQTKERLLEMHGIGLVKLEKYGSIFLKIIQEYCRSHQFEERKKISTTVKRNYESVSRPRHIVIGEAYNSGQSIPDILAAFNIKQDTALSHLYRYLQEGYEIRSDDDLLALSALPATYKARVVKAFEKKGPEFLKPVFDALNGEISYDELKILRLHYLSKNKLTL
jgi:ATP-dependent DNA helicase RecQ